MEAIKKMISSREDNNDDLSEKQEGSTSDNKACSSKNMSSTTTSWSRLKDPRIVRVSRAFGGKDRHSKVCTVRGLRDRRVRLSVPTAIQLYDLQDRLGLNQPSKVVDWLLNAAKHEIDELPPLQMPPGGNFPHSLYPMLASSHQPGAGLGDSDATTLLRVKSSSNNNNNKDVMEETTDTTAANDDKEQNWGRNDEEGHHPHGGGYTTSSSVNNFFQRSSHHQSSAFQGLMNNSMHYNSFLRWDPSNLSLSHGGGGGLPPQPEEYRNFNIVPLTPSMASGSQVVVYPPPQTYFSTQEFDAKHINLQMLTSTSQNHLSNVDSSSQSAVRPFHFSMMANLLPSHNNNADRGHPNKDNDFDSRS